jgi:hypothetical protein
MLYRESQQHLLKVWGEDVTGLNTKLVKCPNKMQTMEVQTLHAISEHQDTLSDSISRSCLIDTYSNEE